MTVGLTLAMGEVTVPVRVKTISYEAEDILSFALERLDREPLPAIEPGAHVDLLLPNGMMRSYSMSNYGEGPSTYRVTVARDVASKGGSTYLHDQIRAGATLQMSAPRNNFALAEDADLSVFIAGGIGVTPFMSMVARLNERGRRWRLHYCVRTRSRAAFLDELDELVAAGHGEMVPNFDDETGGVILDIAVTLDALPAQAHIYCCGPSAMLDAFRAGAAAAGIDDRRVHFEYFKAEVELATDGGFVVVCQKSGLETVVTSGQTILDAINKLGIDVPFSCEEGVCGSCETPVISGEPDHRDMILSDREKKESKTMMICCSGSKGPRLVLDL